jgi:protein-S-isoprenylcysteine O-methyltransferase Ste14
VAAALFAVAIGYWIYSYFWAFGAAAAHAGDVGRAVTVNLSLFTLFALHHSVLARATPKAWVDRRWPGLERTVFVTAASLLLIAVCALWQPLRGVAWQAPSGVGFALRGAQLATGVWVVSAARVLNLSELAGLRPVASGVFQARGPYAIVRHPIYVGWIVAVFAMPTMTMTQLLFAVTGTIYHVIGLELEERSLRGSADGHAYRTYTGRVRYRLVPFLY